MEHRLLGLVDLRADSFEEERHRCVQCGGSVHQYRHGNPVRPALIFLNLLKADAEDFPELSLAHALRLTSGAQTTPDDDIHWITTAFVSVRDDPGWAAGDR